jgi:ABC-type transporter Mla subunit MlaD
MQRMHQKSSALPADEDAAALVVSRLFRTFGLAKRARPCNDQLTDLADAIANAEAALIGARQAVDAVAQAKKDARHAAARAKAVQIGGQLVKAAQQLDSALAEAATAAKVCADLVRELPSTRAAPPRVIRDADSQGSFERPVAAAGLDRVFGIYVARHHAMTMSDHITRLLGPLKPGN